MCDVLLRLGEDGICETCGVVQTGQLKLQSVFMSKTDDPANYDLDWIKLPEVIVDMIPQHDGVLVLGELGNLWLVGDNGVARAVPEEENLWRMVNSRMEYVPESLMPADGDVQPDHIIKAE